MEFSSRWEPDIERSRDEWVALLTTHSKRFRTACAIAGWEQSELGDAIKACEKSGALRPDEIQTILLVQGGRG